MESGRCPALRLRPRRLVEPVRLAGQRRCPRADRRDRARGRPMGVRLLHLRLPGRRPHRRHRPTWQPPVTRDPRTGTGTAARAALHLGQAVPVRAREPGPAHRLQPGPDPLGYGRAFRNALRGQWGERDAFDCADAAENLASVGKADPQRTAIWGASAGGYTALRALIRVRTFAAVARSPVIDPRTWRQTAPKFQAHHTDTLIGPWPEAADVYRARSVLENTDGSGDASCVLASSRRDVRPLFVTGHPRRPFTTQHTPRFAAPCASSSTTAESRSPITAPASPARTSHTSSNASIEHPPHEECQAPGSAWRSWPASRTPTAGRSTCAPAQAARRSTLALAPLSLASDAHVPAGRPVRINPDD